MKKVYYVEFLISDGTMEEQKIQSITASDEAEELESMKECLELEFEGAYKILGIRWVEDLE